MTSVLSPYYSPAHWYPQDEEYIRRLDPAWVRIHQPSARAVEVVQRNAPNARIMLRSWDIDDHNGDRKREMYADPKGAARKHLEMWKAKWDELITELHRNNWSVNENRWYLGLVNEPDPSYVPQVVEYTREAMQIVKGTSIRLGVVCSSVGTFMKPSEGDRGWTQFIPLEHPINEGRHILIVHEYWDPRGPRFGEDAGNLAWRHHIIPLNVPILIGEAGANGFIFNRFSAKDDAGWQRFVPDPKPQTYAAQVKEYIEGCDKRVQGVCLYMLDFHDDNWWSFNTGPAMNELLAIKDARPQVPSPFAPTESTATMYVTATAGLNLRSAPEGDVLIAIPYAAPVTITGVPSVNGWLRGSYAGHSGWLSSAHVSTTKPHAVHLPQVGTPPEVDEPPTPQPTGNDWPRIYAFIKRWEGGWADHPSDPGGATNKGITIGTFIRWRESRGLPTPTKDDLRNITDAEAEQIFFEWYYKASGADKLPWPLNLAQADTAVNAGTGRAAEMLAKSGGDFLTYMGHLITWYTTIPNFEVFGRAWIRRRAEILLEASK